MLFLSGCQLCSNCFYTLPRAIKEEKKKEEGVGHSGVEKEKKTREEFGNKGGESLCLDLEGSRELEGRGFKRSCHGL